jgi:hypothetical protein
MILPRRMQSRIARATYVGKKECPIGRPRSKRLAKGLVSLFISLVTYVAT